MKTITVVVLIMLLFSACTSDEQRSRAILNASLSPSQKIKDGSDLDFELRATRHTFSRKKWLAHYKQEFIGSNVVLLVQISKQNVTKCIEVWKSESNEVFVGKVMNLGLIDNDGRLYPYDPTLKYIIFFPSYPDSDGRLAVGVSKEKLSGCDLSLSELKNELLGQKG